MLGLPRNVSYFQLPCEIHHHFGDHSILQWGSLLLGPTTSAGHPIVPRLQCLNKLASCSCHEELLWSGWLNRTGIYYLTAVEGKFKVKVLAGRTSFPASSSFWWLLVFLGFLALYLCFMPTSPSPQCVASLLIRILSIGFRAHPDKPGGCLHLKILNVVTSAKLFFFFPNKVIFTDSRHWDLDISLWMPFLGPTKISPMLM